MRRSAKERPPLKHARRAAGPGRARLQHLLRYVRDVLAGDHALRLPVVLGRKGRRGAVGPSLSAEATHFISASGPKQHNRNKRPALPLLRAQVDTSRHCLLASSIQCFSKDNAVSGTKERVDTTHMVTAGESSVKVTPMTPMTLTILIEYSISPYLPHRAQVATFTQYVLQVVGVRRVSTCPTPAERTSIWIKLNVLYQNTNADSEEGERPGRHR